MKILFIGDIFGEPGRRAVRERVPHWRREGGVDLVLANVENAAHGRGVTPKNIEEFQSAGVDGFTSGNHIWDNAEIRPFIRESKVLLRPANYISGQPGRTFMILSVYAGVRVGVLNLEGQVGMGNRVNSPFEAADRELQSLKGQADLILVDMHAEATSEKRAMGWHLDGRVAAVVGTHTHVQTADEEILPNGTAYLSDIGMTGPYHSVIGLDKAVALDRFVRHVAGKFEVGQGDVRFCAALIDVDERTGRSRTIQRIQEKC